MAVKYNNLKIAPHAINLVGDMLSEHKISGKVLYVSDKVVDSLYGDGVKAQINGIGKLKIEYIDCNTIEYALSIAEIIIATDIDCIVGLGGGKVLDVCKYAAYISKCQLLSIPTTAANDGIASPIAVLKRKDGKPKSLGCSMPTMLLVDTTVILNSPRPLIMAGIGDTISNYMALLDWDLACKRGKDEMNGYAYLMSKTSLDALLHTQYDTICEGFISVLVNSLVLSGIAMDFAGSSRPVSGLEHLFSHALDYYGKSHNLHGLQVAFGTVAGLKLIGHSINEILDYLSKFHVAINPEKMNIDEETFVTCMQKAISMRANRYTYLNEVDLSYGNLKRIYKELKEDL